MTVETLWKLRNEVREGNASALDLHIELKVLMKEATEVLKEIAPEAIAEARDWEGQTYKGNLIEIRNAGVTWDFSECTKVAEHKKELKHWQEFYKKLVSPVVDPQTGEMHEPAKRSFGRETIFLKKPR